MVKKHTEHKVEPVVSPEMDEFYTLGHQQESMECERLHIDVTLLLQQTQDCWCGKSQNGMGKNRHIRITENNEMDWGRFDEIHNDSYPLTRLHDDSSPLVQWIQDLSIAEDLKMNWERIDELHADPALLVQGIQDLCIAEDLKMNWERIDELHDNPSPLVQGIQNLCIAEDLKMDWQRLDETHNDSYPVQEIQEL
ncbi:hypothetical protein J6590_082920 [Homalodisca vitripennis]|nr:hypothetical protein J6590_082920 [Homalodisca vitripennis]